MPCQFLQVDLYPPTGHVKDGQRPTTATTTASTTVLPPAAPLKFYTAQECAELLRYQKPDKIYLLVRSGILKGFKRGKRWLIDKEHFDRWCKHRCGIL